MRARARTRCGEATSSDGQLGDEKTVGDALAAIGEAPAPRPKASTFNNQFSPLALVELRCLGKDTYFPKLVH